MMKHLHNIALTALALTGMAATAQTPAAGAHLSVADRMLLTDTLYAGSAAATLANPALAGWRHPVSLSAVSVSYRRNGSDEAPVAALGRENAFATFLARTYIKTGKSTITGHASYSTGRRFGVQLCEVSDPQLLYPYFTADEIGGSMASESYVFGGSYSSSFHGGKWLYGASLDYRATQEYRNRDPRPKNTVGRLDAAFGMGHRFDRGYILAADVRASKYRQSNSMMFVSELGEVKIYHLTGLGTDYVRFAGTGKNSNYSGWDLGASLSLYPEESGVYASAAYDRFSLTKILKEFNNRPLCSLRDHSVKAQLGWKSQTWIAGADFGYVRRSGAEHIFGDAAGNVYPELFALDSFRRSSLSVSGHGLWRRLTQRSRLDIALRVCYSADREEYVTLQPGRKSDIRRIDATASARWLRRLSDRWMLHTGADVTVSRNVKASLDGLDGATGIFADGVRKDFYWLSGNSVEADVQAGADCSLRDNRALGIRLAYTRTALRGSNRGYRLAATLAFTF